MFEYRNKEEILKLALSFLSLFYNDDNFKVKITDGPIISNLNRIRLLTRLDTKDSI